MPAEWSDRWIQNEDGTYTRNTAQVLLGVPYGLELESLTKTELAAELELLGLPKTGNKAELIARLEAAHDS